VGADDPILGGLLTAMDVLLVVVVVWLAETSTLLDTETAGICHTNEASL